MSLTIFETPDQGRLGSRSALDFTYWALTFIESAYDRRSVFRPFEGTVEEGQAMIQVIKFAAEQVGIRLPIGFDVIRDRKCNCSHSGEIPLDQALRRRGMLLYRNSGVVISLGDGKRIMQPWENNTYVVRFLVSPELEEGYWMPATIHGMMYL